MKFVRPMNRRAFTIASLVSIVSSTSTGAQTGTPSSTPTARTATYSVEIPNEVLPPAPVAVGAAGVVMTAGSEVTYAEGAAGQSVAIDHVLAGDYTITTPSDLLHIDATGRNTTVAAGQAVTVAAGETIVILRNEAGQKIVAGNEDTRTLTVGFFSLQGGSNETSVEGSLEQQVIGGTILRSLPATPVIVTVIPKEEASGSSDVVARVPARLHDGRDMVVLFLTGTAEATPLA